MSRLQLVLLGCAAAVSLGAPATATATAAAVDSPTYGYGNLRLGSSPGAVGISAAQARHLHTAWVTTLNGAINAQPIVVGGVKFKHGVRNLLLVGTEHGEVAAIDAASGRVLWRHYLGSRRGTHCQATPDNRYGVTSTMVADKNAGRAYVIDVRGRVFAFDMRTGKMIKGWPVYAHPPTGGYFVWGALTLANGLLYVPVASECGAQYHAGIHAIDLADPGRRFDFMITQGSVYDGGVWGWGGVSVDNRTGDVFAATGNSTPDDHLDWAEQVMQFSPVLRLLQHNYPLKPPFREPDRDFGTTPLLIRRAGCPEQAIAFDKDGWLYRYDAAHISQGPRQAIQISTTTRTSIPLYGMAAYDPGTRRYVLTSPAAAPNGRRKGIQSYILTRRCSLAPSWQHGFDNPSAGSSPTIAQGVLYIGTGRNGILRAYRLSTGQELWNHKLGPTIFSTPIAADGTLFAADWGGHVWAFRP